METRNEHIEELLFSYFAGELSPAGEKELLVWLNADKDNSKYLSEMADLWAVAHVPVFDSNKKNDFERRFGDLMRSEIGTSRKIWWITLSKIAAIALLLLMVGALSYFAGNQNIPTEDIVAFETVVPMGARSKVLLPDRSVVWMNAGSSLKYTNAFGKDKREVWLNGEAYFEVEPDSLTPFVVNSEDIDIKVLGTSFNVKAYDDDDLIDVTLISGKVDVHSEKSQSDKRDVILYPDQMLSYDKKTHKMKMVAVNASDACLWIDGNIKFKDLPFSEIAKKLERKYDVRILIESEALKKEIFSGSFSSGRTLDDIFKEIDVENKYKWTRRDSDIIIKDR